MTSAVRDDNGYAIIPIYDKNKVFLENCIVDDELWHELSTTSWSLDQDKYVVGKNNTKMHQMLIKNENPDLVIDHINRVPYDNRKCNLRVVSKSINGHNRSKTSVYGSPFFGVCYNPKSKRPYNATIKKDGVSYSLGTFKIQTDAAIAYNMKAVELYGDHANLNPIDDELVADFNRRKEEKPFYKQSNSTSKYHGVCFKKNKNRWIATIRNDGKDMRIGSFTTEKEASLASNRVAKELKGDKAKQNVF